MAARDERAPVTAGSDERTGAEEGAAGRALNGARADELLDFVFDAVLVRDARTDVIRQWNQGATELYGWTADEAIGRPAEDLLRTSHPVPRALIEAELPRMGSWTGMLEQVARNGRRLLIACRWVLQRSRDGEPESVVEIHRDVTSAGRTKARLQRSEDSFRLLVSCVMDYAIFMLDPNGIVTTWNDGAERIKGYAAEEIIGRHFSTFYEAVDVVNGKPAAELAAARRDGRLEDEGWRLRKDGTRFWANVVITALRDDTGRLHGFAKVTRDVTERRATEQRRIDHERAESRRLRDHGERIAQLEKVKSDFLNLASHELRGPLAVVKGYVSMFEDHTMTPDELPGVLPLLTSKVQEIELLVQQMLETARLEEGRLALHVELFDLRRVAQRVLARFGPTTTSRHELRLSLPDRPVMVEADRARVETVIANLVDNAIKYSPSGGAVACKVAAEEGRALVSVEDAGVGIALGSIEQLFRRFSRILTPETAHVGGTGLGLYISREIARRHGGDILVESRAGRGSRFILALPAHD
jgi:PAS domain S-box-containing protein